MPNHTKPYRKHTEPYQTISKRYETIRPPFRFRLSKQNNAATAVADALVVDQRLSENIRDFRRGVAGATWAPLLVTGGVPLAAHLARNAAAENADFPAKLRTIFSDFHFARAAGGARAPKGRQSVVTVFLVKPKVRIRRHVGLRVGSVCRSGPAGGGCRRSGLSCGPGPGIALTGSTSR